MVYSLAEKILLKLNVWVVTGLLWIVMGYLCVLFSLMAGVFVSLFWATMMMLAAFAFFLIGASFLDAVTKKAKAQQKKDKGKQD